MISVFGPHGKARGTMEIPLDDRAGYDIAQAPIEYEYMTFETEYPPPIEVGHSKEGVPLPPPPDVRRYGSPFEWNKSRKLFVTYLSCTITVATAYSAGAYVAALDQLTTAWGISDVAFESGVTVFTAGFASAPMVLAPFSEINGRYPVFVVTGILFVLCHIFCALTRSFAGMLLARFFSGVGGSTFSTMVGGVVSDIYHAEDRNTPMALFAGAAMFGTGLGPLVSGFIAQNTSWKWVFYVQAILCAFLILLVIVFFKETRGSVLLSRRAGAINAWYDRCEESGFFVFVSRSGDGKKAVRERLRWKVKADEERESLGKMIRISVYRPFHLLSTEPVVFFFSLWISFSWAVLYLNFSSIPLVFTTNHGFNLQQNGAVFSSMCIAALLSTALSISQEKLARRYGKLSSTPERRLYFACVQSALLPIGLFWFGWTSFPNIPWIVPTLAIGCATMGNFSIYLAVFNYLADTYHRYASSALAAQSFCRNMLGGAFPVITVTMFRHLTYQGASSLLGGIGALLTLVPWVLVFYGPRIRARSKFASEIMET